MLAKSTALESLLIACARTSPIISQTFEVVRALALRAHERAKNKSKYSGQISRNRPVEPRFEWGIIQIGVAGGVNDFGHTSLPRHRR